MLTRNSRAIGFLRSIAILSACSTAGAALAQPRVTLLGGGTAATGGLNSTGTVVAGSYTAGSLLTVGTTVTGASLPGFTIAAGTPNQAYFAGSTAAGPARWVSATSSAQTLTRAPSLQGSMTVNDISADGRYIVGWGYLSGSLGAFLPWVWDAQAAGGAGQMFVLPTGGGNSGQAKVVGLDGTVAGVDGCCGSNNRPVFWRFDAGTSAWVVNPLPANGAPPVATGGDISAMNDAGTVIVGSVVTSPTTLYTTRWTWNPATQSWATISLAPGQMVTPSWLSTGYSVTSFIPLAVTEDGATIVGATVYALGSDFIRGGFSWTPTTFQALDFYDSMVTLGAPNIAALGGNPPALGFPVAMTGDGLHIVTYAGPQTGFGPPTLIDFNGGPCVQPTVSAVNSTTSIPAGTAAHLNASVTGSETLTIQWRFNGNPISDGPSGTGSTYYGATGAGTIGVQLVITNTSPADNGTYDCVITNACGSATRPPLTLTVNTGGCCTGDGSGNVTCTVDGSSHCSGSVAVGGLGGIYLGDGTTCSPAACNGASGACCSSSGGPATCVLDVSPHCTLATASGGLAGVFLGNGVACSPTACNAVSGACCYSPDGLTSVICSVELSSHCTQSTTVGGLAGAYAGDSTTCTGGTNCPAGTVGVGACCFNATALSDIACSVQTSTHCTGNYTSGGLQGKYEGDGVACGASTCRPSTFGTGSGIGACCFTDPNNPGSGAICLISTTASCTNYPNGSNDANAAPFNIGLGGNFYTNTCCGPSTTPPISGCSTTANCAATAGACVHSSFGSTTDVICTVQVRASRCTRLFNAGGLFGVFNAGSTCSPSVIAASAGACCYTPAGQSCIICTIQPQTMCTQVNNGGLAGTFGGLGTTCTSAPCNLHTGACCVFTSCITVCAADCAANAGTYRGDGSPCTPDPCATTGVCCRGATCSQTSGPSCTVASGTAGAHFVGPGACGTSATSPCCYADYNKANGISVQDIFDFLTDWFSGSPYAHTGGNGAGGTLSVQNIFDFLSDWFSGGC